jgi:hypothetical protein
LHHLLIRMTGAAAVLSLSLACGSSSQTMTSPGGTRCALHVQSDPLTFSPGGGSGQLRVSTARECAWAAQSDAAWLSLSSTANGQGEGTVQFTVAPNVDPAARSGSIGVNDERLQVSQAGRPCELQLSSTRESFGGDGGVRTVTVTASSALCVWTATSTVPWVEVIAGREGQGSGAVTFRVAPGDDVPRSGAVNVGGHAVEVTVTASPACTVAVDPASYTVSVAGGTGTLSVRAPEGCAWSAESTVSWMAITAGQRGSGPGEVRFAVPPADGAARSGAIRVGPVEVAVSHGPVPCSYATAPASVTVPAQGAGGTVHVTAPAGCAWTARGSAPWIVMAEAGGGVGSGQIGYLVTANTGPAREGTMTVAGHTIAVTQATGCTYALSGPRDLPAGGGGSVMGLTTAAGCAWSAASGAEWLTVSPASGAGPAQVQLAATPNNGPPRTTTVTIGGVTETIGQASPCTWSFAPSSIEVDAGGGFGTVLVLVTGACTWTAVSQAPWVTLVLAAGSGSGMVQMHIAPNVGPARSGIVTIGGVPYTITQRAP